MKAENDNKRTKRKEIQFSEAEYAVVEQKANAARLSVAAFIREAALGKELSAALSLEESERIKRTANISYKMRLAFCNGSHPGIHQSNQRIFQDRFMA